MFFPRHTLNLQSTKVLDCHFSLHYPSINWCTNVASKTVISGFQLDSTSATQMVRQNETRLIFALKNSVHAWILRNDVLDWIEMYPKWTMSRSWKMNEEEAFVLRKKFMLNSRRSIQIFILGSSQNWERETFGVQGFSLWCMLQQIVNHLLNFYSLNRPWYIIKTGLITFFSAQRRTLPLLH